MPSPARQFRSWPLVVDGRPLDVGRDRHADGFGYIMMLAASPAVAERIVRRATCSSSSRCSSRGRRRDRGSGLAVVAAQYSPRGNHRLHHCIGPTMATMLIGVEIKGARR